MFGGLVTYVEARSEDEKHEPSSVGVRLNYEVIRDTGKKARYI